MRKKRTLGCQTGASSGRIATSNSVSMIRNRPSSTRGSVIARHEIDYLLPVAYHPQPLRLELWVDEVRGASFGVRYEVYDGERLVARAATRCVPFDFATDRPRRLTPAERALLAAFVDEPR